MLVKLLGGKGLFPSALFKVKAVQWQQALHAACKSQGNRGVRRAGLVGWQGAGGLAEAAAMGLTEQKVVMDMLAWAGNVSSSVLIIFVNKILMNKTGYGFKYGECPQKNITPCWSPHLWLQCAATPAAASGRAVYLL
jgi:hypothetical protein